jgi:hypothetical protein
MHKGYEKSEYVFLRPVFMLMRHNQLRLESLGHDRIEGNLVGRDSRDFHLGDGLCGGSGIASGLFCLSATGCDESGTSVFVRADARTEGRSQHLDPVVESDNSGHGNAESAKRGQLLFEEGVRPGTQLSGGLGFGDREFGSRSQSSSRFPQTIGAFRKRNSRPALTIGLSS